MAKTRDGEFISWVEHLIDDEGVNGGEAIRGGDGLLLADIDADGHQDIVSVHEDSHHLRVAFGSADPDGWTNITIAQGLPVGAIEDVAVGDLNGDGALDLIAACEEAHLTYFQNPGSTARTAAWRFRIPSITKGRGSWIRVAIADMNGDGNLDVLGANKGYADVAPLDGKEPGNNPTSMFTLSDDPLEDNSWRERVLLRDGIPNHVIPVDIDADGDPDLLTADRVAQRMTIVENLGTKGSGRLQTRNHAIRLTPGFETPGSWTGAASAFNAVFADMNGDGRKDLIVQVMESEAATEQQTPYAGLGWLAQPAELGSEWVFHRIGNILPDWVTGIGVADIDTDGDPDVITGGYSGINILQGGYSGASRDVDDPSVTPASSVARMAWFENPGDACDEWLRHDISRNVRGMYDAFVPRDMDMDGDVDFVATRGNSGSLDGVFWLEQRRSRTPVAAFRAARKFDSKALPLPPLDWRLHYEKSASNVPPNKDAQQRALHR